MSNYVQYVTQVLEGVVRKMVLQRARKEGDRRFACVRSCVWMYTNKNDASITMLKYTTPETRAQSREDGGS